MHVFYMADMALCNGNVARHILDKGLDLTMIDRRSVRALMSSSLSRFFGWHLLITDSMVEFRTEY